MANSTAKFKIEASPSTDGGYDAAASATLTLQLEASPALDVQTCVYSVPIKTAGAPTPTLAGDGIASPPTDTVDLTLGAGAHAYVVMCQTNGGAAVKDDNGKDDWTVNTSYRIVVVRTTSAGLRKIVVGESLQYDTAEGWVAAINEMVDAIETLSAAVDAVEDYAVAGGRWDMPAVFVGNSGPETVQPSIGQYVRIDLGLYGAGDVCTVELPTTVADDLGRRIRVAEITGNMIGFNQPELHVTTTGGQTIDGVFLLPYKLTGNRPRATFVSTGSGWSLEEEGKGLQFAADGPKLNLNTTPVVQEPTAISATGSTTIDFASTVRGPKVEITLTGNTTLENPSNVQKGARYQVKIINGAGPFTVAWGTNWKFGGTSSTVTAAASAIDIFEFEGDSGGILRVVHASFGVHA